MSDILIIKTNENTKASNDCNILLWFVSNVSKNERFKFEI
jgi:hypothetical protein